MKKYKSAFEFSKGNRKGIFLLLTVIIFLQLGYFYFENNQVAQVTGVTELELYQKEIDSLKMVKVEESKPKVFPFNPNFITDYKGYTLGMSNEEIDRLIEFRKSDQWINSTKQFQEVTQVSDSLLAAISPYFKFPEWVTNPKPRVSFTYPDPDVERPFNQKIDLNRATVAQLKKINGIGDALSKRIVDYRSKQPNGFIADVQLQEVYGLSSEVIERITNQFTVKTPAKIERFDLNFATRDQLVTIKYIDYEIAHNIIEYRTLNEGFKNLDDLRKVKDFPVNKIDIIKLYLQLK